MADGFQRLATALADRYRPERELGTGGMATVYLAEDLRHNRKVALKVLRPELGRALGFERFLREIRTTAALDHPNILTLIDSGEADGLVFYAMPYVSGESLRARLERDGALSFSDAVAIVQGAASALEFAHRRGIVHRDVKPENILLHEGVPMVADFGIALAANRLGSERLTETGFSLGTPAYMSPEQVTGTRELDGRSDQYSLACVLYEALTGTPPFTAPTAQGVFVKHVTEVAPPVRGLRDEVPSAVANAVERALSKDPDRRYGTMGEFRAALTQPATLVTPALAKSIVVLPFDNLSPDPNDAYLADGLTEELISDLSRIRTLKVISRNSAIAAKQRTRDVREVARLVDVRYVLEGSVRRSGTDLRIIAQLIDGRTDAHVWTEKYTGTMDDVFAMQERLSRAIVAALRIELGDAQVGALRPARAMDRRAYEAYLRHRAALLRIDSASLAHASEDIRRVIAIAGENPHLIGALAYADTWTVLLGFGDTATLRRAGDSARRALDLDPDSGLAHFAQALYLNTIGDWRRGDHHFRIAVELEPISEAHGSYGIRLAALGDVEAARGSAERALAVDPLSTLVLWWASVVELVAGEPNRALDLAARCEANDPDGVFSQVATALSLAHSGNGQSAIAHFERARRQSDAPLVQALTLSWEAALSGRSVPQPSRDARIALLSHTFHSLCWIAEPLALAGQHHEALWWIRNAVYRGFVNTRYMTKVSPFLASLRGDPEFEILMIEADSHRSTEGQVVLGRHRLPPD